MAEVFEKYKFNGKKMLVWYDPNKKEPYPTKIRYMYDDWLPMEVITKARRRWIFFGIFVGCILTYFIR